MTTPVEELTDIHLFVKKHVQGPWESRGEEIFLYRTANQRLKIVFEQAQSHEDLWRYDALADHNLWDVEVDGEQLGKDFVEKVGNHLSISDMQYLVKHLQGAIDAWNEKIEKIAKEKISHA